ncbi:MAG: hypothetical protein V3U04_07830, partial [Candidatus Aerophobetes bacterium]
AGRQLLNPGGYYTLLPLHPGFPDGGSFFTASKVIQARPKSLPFCGHGCQGTLRLLRVAG